MHHRITLIEERELIKPGAIMVVLPVIHRPGGRRNRSEGGSPSATLVPSGNRRPGAASQNGLAHQITPGEMWGADSQDPDRAWGLANAFAETANCLVQIRDVTCGGDIGSDLLT